MENTKTRFKDLSWVLKVAAIGGFCYSLLFALDFIYGFLYL